MPAPAGIAPPRWAALAATSARLLRDHGPDLHRAGWDTLDLFGLHSVAPTENPTGWGLAWLLGSGGQVLNVSAEAVGMSRDGAGVRLAFRRRATIDQGRTIPAWTLGN